MARTIIARNLYEEIAIYASAVGLLFVCSQIYIPLDPVPITMQSVGIMLIALLYDASKGLISYAFYLALGVLGVPVFSQYAAGANVLFGASFGYFVGFFMAIYAMNLIKAKIGIDSFISLTLNCLVGTMIIFIPGILWLSLTLGWQDAVAVGLLPFIFPGIIKTLVLAGLIKALRILK